MGIGDEIYAGIQDKFVMVLKVKYQMPEKRRIERVC